MVVRMRKDVCQTCHSVAFLVSVTEVSRNRIKEAVSHSKAIVSSIRDCQLFSQLALTQRLPDSSQVHSISY